jgi:hypothetical protein
MEAVQKLRTVRPMGDRMELSWSVSGPLPGRHLTLARLLLGQNKYSEALRTASIFDHPTPVVFYAFLRESLEIRLEAARALGLSGAEEEYEERLLRLGVSG